MQSIGTPLNFGRKHATASNRRHRCRPSLEPCEGRVLLTTYTVTALTDLGIGQGAAGDLRYCIRRADLDGRHDTITFAVTGTIQLSSALPPLGNARGIAIAGPGAESLTVRGGGASSRFTIFKVGLNATAAIEGLTIADGYAKQSGGGIFNAGKLTITGVTFTGNSAASSGGGIYTLGPVAITNSTFTGNSAASSGGGIYTLGPVAITNSTFTGNSAAFSGGGIETTYSTVKITNTTLDDNSAGVFGGGISVNAERFLHDVGGKLTLDNSTLIGNTAGTTNGHGIGGGIASNVSEIHINGTSFTSNASGRVAGGVGIDGGTLSVAHSTFSDNTTGGSGGGILINGGISLPGREGIQGASLVVAASTFIGNSAGRNGGGIDAILTLARVTDATLAANSAGSSGGGISVESNSPLNVTQGALRLDNSTLGGNRAGRKGGGISNLDHVILADATVAGNLAGDTGGGIYNGKSLKVAHSLITENRPNNITGAH